MSSLKLSFVIEAVDRATARVRAVTGALDKITEPARRVRAAFNGLVNESGLSRLGEQWDNVGKRVGRVRELVAGVRNAVLAAAAAGGALYFGMSKVTERMDKVVDDSKMLNVPVEWLQEMGQAAEQAGGSVDGMTDALRFLSRNQAEALAGGKEQTQWFARAGISLDKLKKMSLPQVLGAISDKFKAVGDVGQNAQKKLAVTQALMGRGGFEMVQFLSKGSEGIADIVKALRSAGTIVDKDTAGDLADFNDNLAMLRGNLFATIAVIARAALPVFQKITEAVMGWSKGNRELMATRVQEYAEKILTRLPSIITGLAQVASGIGAVIGVVDSIAQAMGGWQKVIMLLAAVWVLKLILAIGSLTVALFGLWPALVRIALAFSTVLWPAVAQFFTGLAWMAAASISIVASWVVAAGASVWGFATTLYAALVPAFGAAAAAAWGFAAALLANPITWIVVAIAGAALLLYKYWGPISAFFQQLWAGISAVFTSGLALIAAVVETASAGAVDLVMAAWGELTDFFDGLWGGIESAFAAVFARIVGRIQAVAGFVTGAVAKVASLLPGGGDAVAGAQGAAGAPGAAGAGGLPLGAALGLGAPAGPAGAAAGSALGKPGAGRTQVGGQLTIKIDQEGRAKVAELRSDNADVPINVYSGNYMAGA